MIATERNWLEIIRNQLLVHLISIYFLDCINSDRILEPDRRVVRNLKANQKDLRPRSGPRGNLKLDYLSSLWCSLHIQKGMLPLLPPLIDSPIRPSDANVPRQEKREREKRAFPSLLGEPDPTAKIAQRALPRNSNWHWVMIGCWTDSGIWLVRWFIPSNGGNH